MEVDITFPPSDANKPPKEDEDAENETEKKEEEVESSQSVFTIPYWDNVICTMRYSEEYAKVGKLRVGSGDSLLDEEPEIRAAENPILE